MYLPHTDDHDLDGAKHPDVEIASLLDGQILQYESASGKWKNVTPVSSNPPMAKMYKTTQNINSGSWTVLQYDTGVYDTGSLMGTNRFDISVAGVYAIKVGMGTQNTDTDGDRYGNIRKNGTDSLLQERRNATAPDHSYWSMATDAKLAVDDYIEFLIYQNSGSILATGGGIHQHWASIVRLGDG